LRIQKSIQLAPTSIAILDSSLNELEWFFYICAEWSIFVWIAYERACWGEDGGLGSQAWDIRGNYDPGQRNNAMNKKRHYTRRF
jgi:hypothetical protein